MSSSVSALKMASSCGEGLDEFQRVGVEDGVLVIGFDQHDDRIEHVERLTDGPVDFDLVRVGGNEGMAVRAKPQSQRSGRDSGRHTKRNDDHDNGVLDRKTVKPGQETPCSAGRDHHVGDDGGC
jgi:hypothetical protein